MGLCHRSNNLAGWIGLHVTLESGNDSKHNTVCFVKTKSEVVIPAHGETLLPVHVQNRKVCNIDNVTGVIDPAASLPIKHHVVGAKCTVVLNMEMPLIDC